MKELPPAGACKTPVPIWIGLLVWIVLANGLSAAVSGNFTYTDNGTSVTITDYPTTAVGAVVIPESINQKPVTAIGSLAFDQCSGLTSVTIPPGVTRIGIYAFSGCRGLTGITVPSGVTLIERSTFSDCSGLITVSLPASVTAIRDFAFSGCRGLTSLLIPAGVMDLGGSSFAGCSGLTRLTIPSSVTSIGPSAFENCDGLASVTILPGLQLIGSQAFTYCNVLTQVTIPSSVTYIGSSAFAGSGLASAALPSSVTTIGSNAFAYCSDLVSITVDAANPNYSSSNGVLYNQAQTQLVQYPKGKSGGYAIPSSVTVLGNDAFYGADGLTQVTLPPGLTTIGDRAFSYCRGLTSVVIPSAVTHIGIGAFGYCYGLTSVAIPASVTNIGAIAFTYCSNAGFITVAAGNANYSSKDGVLFNKNQTELIQCPAGMSGAYVVPAGVTGIGDSAFFGCAKLTGVAMPSGVVRIGTNVFTTCSELTKVSIPASVTDVGYAAFDNCRKLVSATFAGNAPVMGSPVFRSVASGFKVYYFNGATGFTSPTWLGYPSFNLGALSPVGSWLLARGFFHDDPLQSDPNGDGVNLLLAYALNLDPRQNLSGSLPRPVMAGGQMGLSFYAGTAGVAYAVETSTDLQVWSTAGVTLSAPDANQMRTATVARSGSNQFLRLAVRN